MAVGGDKAVEIGESRRFARHVERPEIGEQDAAAQHDGIILLPDALAQPAGFGLGRGLQAFAVDIEQPAMEGAAQAAVFRPAEGEVGNAMRAVAVEQAIAALLVAEQHEILQIGRESCTERECQYVWISVVAVSLKKKKQMQQQT